MTRKEFREELLKIREDWRRLAEEDPTFYHRSIKVDVGEDVTYIEAVYDGRRAEEYTLEVKLTDGEYRIHVLIEPCYVNPVDDIMTVIEKNKLAWEYCNTV